MKDYLFYYHEPSEDYYITQQFTDFQGDWLVYLKRGYIASNCDMKYHLEFELDEDDESLDAGILYTDKNFETIEVCNEKELIHCIFKYIGDK